MQAGRTPTPTPRMRTWNTPTVLALILGAVGTLGIIELRPQMSVTPQDPVIKAEAFSAPFRIDNAGYFSFYVDHVFLYLNELKNGATSIGDSSSHEPEWNCFVLDRAESRTIITQFSNGTPTKADIAIAIDYRPFRTFPFYFRKYFRFIGAHGDSWQWLKQPSSDIQTAADSRIEDHMRKIPSSRLCKSN